MGISSKGEDKGQGSVPERNVCKLHYVKKHLLLNWKGGRDAFQVVSLRAVP